MRATLLGLGVTASLALATAAASWHGSPLPAGAPEGSDLPSAVFLAAAGCAFALYLGGLVFLRRFRAGLATVCALAAAIQLVPLAGPLLLSRDVFAYWDYGRLAAAHDANPYSVPPARFARDPAERAMALGYRLLAAAGMLALVALAAVFAPARAFAAAFVGWNRFSRSTWQAEATTTSG